MANPVLDAPQFKTEEQAFAYVESRLWPQGPVCPHCGNMDGARIRKMAGKTTRAGLYKCNECRKPFTVRMGTIFESSHLPLHLWLQVIHLMCASKKGISTRQIQRSARTVLQPGGPLDATGDLAATGHRMGFEEFDDGAGCARLIGHSAPSVTMTMPKAGSQYQLDAQKPPRVRAEWGRVVVRLKLGQSYT